jgi:hypothetical protein
MPMKTTLLSLALLTGLITAKEPVKFNELKLADGTVLQAATVLRTDPEGLHIEHRDGVSKVKFENLPASVQEQFKFDREAAERFRVEREEAIAAREAAEKQARVEALLAKQRTDQEEDVRRGREEFFALLGSGEYSYPQLERILLDSIAALQAAGREDLAAVLEDDRKLLREREVNRPAESLRRERDQLATRVRDLENQIALLNNRPADPPDEHSSVIWPIYVDRPVIFPVPVTVNPGPPPCPPGTPLPNVRPAYSPNPAVRPALQPGTGLAPRTVVPSPTRPSPVSVPRAPMTPQGPRIVPAARTGGAQVSGAHLWKK